MADSETSKEDRTLPASERRLEQAREKGQIPRSRDLAHFAVLGTSGGLIAMMGPSAMDVCTDIVRAGLRFDSQAALQTGNLVLRLGDSSIQGALIVAITGFVLITAAVAAALGIGGWIFSLTPITPQFSRMSPTNLQQRIFSMQGMAEIAKLVALTVIIVAVAYLFVTRNLDDFVGAMTMSLPASMQHLNGMLFQGMSMILGVVLLTALADVPLQIWRHYSNLRMTPEEAKRESRESDGDPHLKGRIRSMQREMARKRMLAEVPKASVVVTNPTHYAVALVYDDQSAGAPRVVAKGADVLAAKIREVAAANGVPLLEAPPLARALYAHAELDREIPVSLYTAVAQVLAYVFQLRMALSGQGVAPRSAPNIEVPDGLDPKDAVKLADTEAG